MKTTDDRLHSIKRYEEYTRSHQARYVAEISHKGLGTFKIIKDMNSYILSSKIDAQFRIWEDKWLKQVDKNQRESEKDASLALANERTKEAQNALKEIDNLLSATLSIDDTVNWDSLKDKSQFEVPNPKNNLDKAIEELRESFPRLRRIPKEPDKANSQPDLSLIDYIFKSLKQKKIAKAEEQFQKWHDEWKDNMNEYNLATQEFERQKEDKINEFNQLEAKWKEQEIEFYRLKNENNDKIVHLKELYLNCDQNAVIEYCELVLNNSNYPDSFPKDFDLEYNSETKILIIEYLLPSIECFPTLTEVKYISTKKEMKESYLSDSLINKMFDDSIYKITLRTIHELFEADRANALDAIIFNGWVNAINKATGKMVNNCIVSIQVKKTEFLEINLSNIDSKTCFKNLKGIGSSKLSGITAIQPIAQINKNDKRFVSPQDVIEKLNEGLNLAAMDWEEFEHLIREIFEEEFKSAGGEVKVTQASRDGGVDAVAFDPDPIRGGKIIIQAKRYTNTVGVSAVRDLYGTVVNEGVTKGILVTTADYGPDAYEFAKNKPLTLMNGSNLLYLLQKHGHKARIDIDEARKLLL